MCLPIIPPPIDPNALPRALERAASAIARLDQALNGHPLLPAFLYRARLEAIRQQAASDGHAIEPWHLAALLEGVRMRMDPDLSLAERGEIFAAARHAFAMYRWLVTPDGNQQAEIQRATTLIRDAVKQSTPLLGAVRATHDWLTQGGRRGPLRAALVQYWVEAGLLHVPLPLTGPQALAGDLSFDLPYWIPRLLQALAREAETWLSLLRELDCAWRRARTAAGARRCNSRAASAIDCLAAAPLLSASRLAHQLGMAPSNALLLLRDFQAQGLVVEVSHRTKRRLFGLAGMEVMCDHVSPPRRPLPGRGRGRPRLQDSVSSTSEDAAFPAEMPPSRIELPSFSFDYSELDAAIAEADRIIHKTSTPLTQNKTPSLE